MSNPPLHTSPHFRWRAGMRRSDGEIHPSDNRRPVDPNTEPDMNDPGTVGHVLALYRLATDDPWANLEAYTERWVVVDQEGSLRGTPSSTAGGALRSAFALLRPPALLPEPQLPVDPPTEGPGAQVPLFPATTTPTTPAKAT